MAVELFGYVLGVFLSFIKQAFIGVVLSVLVVYLAVSSGAVETATQYVEYMSIRVEGVKFYRECTPQELTELNESHFFTFYENFIRMRSTPSVYNEFIADSSEVRTTLNMFNRISEELPQCGTIMSYVDVVRQTLEDDVIISTCASTHNVTPCLFYVPASSNKYGVFSGLTAFMRTNSIEYLDYMYQSTDEFTYTRESMNDWYSFLATRGK